MKLSDYAKQAGISYQTAWRMWKREELNAYQLPTGTIRVKTEESEITSESVACIYSRVSSTENKSKYRQAVAIAIKILLQLIFYLLF